MNADYGFGKTFDDLCVRNKFWCHTPARLIRSRIPERVWNSYFKFCVDRNPWDKTLSHYFWLKNYIGGKLSLDEYFERGEFCRNIPWYTDRSGTVMVDRVLRYEQLADGLAEVFKITGIPFTGSLGVDAKSEYRTDRRPYQEVLSHEQRQIIERVFADEIALHNYTY